MIPFLYRVNLVFKTFSLYFVVFFIATDESPRCGSLSHFSFLHDMFVLFEFLVMALVAFIMAHLHLLCVYCLNPPYSTIYQQLYCTFVSAHSAASEYFTLHIIHETIHT